MARFVHTRAESGITMGTLLANLQTRWHEWRRAYDDLYGFTQLTILDQLRQLK